MPQPALRDLCLKLIAPSVDRFLALQWSDGRFAAEPERDTEEWDFYQQQYLLPAALLYTLEDPRNPWRGDARLWQAILRNGRHLVSRVAPDGSMTWRLRGVVLEHPFVCQRLTCAWLMAYQRLARCLPEADAELWRSTILRACEWLVQRHLLPHREVQRFTSHDVGTGTNHFSLYLSLIYLAGRELGKPDWVGLSSGLMKRLIADQRPGGYWEEHHGPTLAYNYLTYHGVDQYTAWSGDELGKEALRRGLALHRHWTFPDGTAVECVDGRVRHQSGVWPWGLAGFTRWPEGRGFARLLIESMEGRELSGEMLARLADAFLMLHEGEEESPPQAHALYRATLDQVSVVHKEGPWLYGLSGHCSPRWPENQFCLDRQALASVWREGIGLVLDGSNSKCQPGLATFCRGAGEQADSLPLKAELLTTGEEGEEAVEVSYASFTATLRARVVDSASLELAASVRAQPGPEQVMLTLVPNTSFGERVILPGGAEVMLREEPIAARVGASGGTLAFGNMQMRLPPQTLIEYPISPFNSYSADNTSPPSANRLVVRSPVGEEWTRFLFVSS